MRKHKTYVALMSIGAICIAFSGILTWKTCRDLRDPPKVLDFGVAHVHKMQLRDRNGEPLTVTYQNRWNIHDQIPLHEMPPFLIKAFLCSEDHRFFKHSGVDWLARIHALFQNIAALKAVRGASTISEQVIRMIHPRPRTLWSRWLEGFEAVRLEKEVTKEQILECYLNQVPYAARRRGVQQAARYYFARDPDTLSHKEMLALAVMVRAPGRLDLHKKPDLLEGPILRLSSNMLRQGLIDAEKGAQIKQSVLKPEIAPALTAQARHFAQHLLQIHDNVIDVSSSRLRTTLDAPLQARIQRILDRRLTDLKSRHVQNGAVLVVDHKRNEIRAWVNSGSTPGQTAGSWIDAVNTPRQPGSTLKPFLYALALENGWSAATLVKDFPLAAPVGRGLHVYHNYSHVYYGPLTLREALGNSLNTPAIRTIQFVGVPEFLNCLARLGFKSLTEHPDYYGEGLALGNGEVTLLELVQAYAVLANAGVYRPLKTIVEGHYPKENRRLVFSPETASLIGNILSDPDARKLEFGQGSLLRFPIQTAVKTGTSSDYRDAWAVGFNDRYTAGVWMGNLDHRAMRGITGATGPALLLRSIFAELNRNRETRPLYLSPRLVQKKICIENGMPANEQCTTRLEWFDPGSPPLTAASASVNSKRPYLQKPSHGLNLAMDPRIPDEDEAFQCRVANLPQNTMIQWIVDGKLMAYTSGEDYLWPLSRGKHSMSAEITQHGGKSPLKTKSVNFTVK